MLVTILTPTLNAERFFPECLQSLRAQSYPRDRIQHLVLDGGSSDRTVQLARDAGAETHVARDGSLYAALNSGLRLARGEIVGWLNADDTFEPEAIRCVVEAFRADPGVEVVVGDYVLSSKGESRVVRADPGALARIRAGKPGSAWVIPLAVFFRLGTLRGLGEYLPGYRVAADLDMWLRAAARATAPRVAHAGTVIGTFRMHGESLSSGLDPEKSYREILEIERSWFERPDCPDGVRRFALFLLRRHTHEFRLWQVRQQPRWRRTLATLATYRELQRLGPGALRDMWTRFW
jgi:glycosyltransferase involved in cell wall biosynthesis